MKALKKSLLSFCWIAMAWVSAGQDPVREVAIARIVSPSPKPVTFAAMADIPYNAQQEIDLRAGIGKINSDPTIDFVIHLGDIKSGASPCVESVYENVSGILRGSSRPVFIVLGDNEWNDCGNLAQIGAAWGYWAPRFIRFDRNWSHSFDVAYQDARPENFRFTSNGVLFLGLNVPGSKIPPGLENAWAQRLADDVDWIDTSFAEFASSARAVVVFGHCSPPSNNLAVFDRLRAEAKTYSGPILFMYGDGHTWHPPRPDPKAPNFFTCQLDGGGKPGWLTKVTVTLDPSRPFTFDR